MIDVSLSMMVFVFICFLIGLFLFNKWLFKPILTFMDNRDSSIRNDLENVNSNATEVEELKLEAERIISEAKKEAHKIKDSAQKEAKGESQKRVESKRAELEKGFEEFKRNLEEEKNNLKNSLLSQMPLYKESLKAKLSQL